MIDMSKWRSKIVDVLDDVDLDPLNVRLEQDQDAPEADVILDLFENEKALDLVQSIVTTGYLTHEVPIVIKRKDRFVVVEGNRRVAALKAIQNPFLVPDFHSRITALTNGFTGRDALRKIEVKIAPDQDEADQLIATLHAGNPRLAWTPARQAAFFQAQIDAGKTYKQLKANYPTIEIDKYVIRSEMLKRFLAVKYATPEINAFVKSRDFSATTLARVYETKAFIQLTGLKLNTAGQLVMTPPKRVVDQMARVIVQGMFDKNIDSRSINTTKSPRFKLLIEELQEIVHPTPTPKGGTGSGAGKPAGGSGTGTGGGAGAGSGRGSGGSGGGGASGGGPSPGGGTGTGAGGGTPGGRPARGKKPNLDVARLVAPAGFPPSVDRILQEFSTLNVDAHPNAAFDLLRTLLEKTIKSFAEAGGEEIKKTNNQKGYVYLSDCLKWLEDWFSAHGPRSQVQVVQKIRSNQSRDFHGSTNLMNAINHNHKIVADGNDVRASFDTMQPVLAEILK